MIVITLPPIVNLDVRFRADVQNRLENATRECSAPDAKEPRFYEVLGKLDPYTLESLLPSFGRAFRILDEKLSSR